MAKYFVESPSSSARPYNNTSLKFLIICTGVQLPSMIMRSGVLSGLDKVLNGKYKSHRCEELG